MVPGANPVAVKLVVFPWLKTIPLPNRLPEAYTLPFTGGVLATALMLYMIRYSSAVVAVNVALTPVAVGVPKIRLVGCPVGATQGGGKVVMLPLNATVSYIEKSVQVQVVYSNTKT